MSIQNSQYRFIFSVTRWGQTNTNQQNDNVLHQDIVTEINIHFLRGGGGGVLSVYWNFLLTEIRWCMHGRTKVIRSKAMTCFNTSRSIWDEHTHHVIHNKKKNVKNLFPLDMEGIVTNNFKTIYTYLSYWNTTLCMFGFVNPVYM